jgi:hypothetical protein
VKKISQLGLLLALVFGAVSPVQAGLLVEPLIGYNFNSNVDFEDGENYSGGMGPAFGGRIGYQNLGLQLGVDYLKSTIDMDDSDFKDDVSSTQWAAFVGYQFPILVRLYAGYIFSATAETEYLGSNTDFKKGSGTMLGASFTGLPFVSINFEFRNGTFTERKIGSSEVDKDDDFRSYLLSVSLPLNF